jgi:hypothetical protein
MITRENKLYLYRCELCGITRTAPDQLRITEQRRLHTAGVGTHWANRVQLALGPFTDAISKLAGDLAPVIEQMNALNRPAPNTPHDPALLTDKRKWGGR